MSIIYDYNLAQQIYALSAASNAVGLGQDDAPTMQNKLLGALTGTLSGMSGGWSVSWGPCVYKPGTKYPENVFYAAVDGTKKYVVVAVAGTAPFNDADWFNDFDVASVVDFAAWISQWTINVTPPTASEGSFDPHTAYISKGTANGVYNVLSQQSTMPSDDGQSIWQYLAGLDPSYTIIFAGHSMGGAIAPTMALGLKMSGLTKPHTMYAMPSAGASPGNKAFNKLYATTNSFVQTPVPGIAQPYAFFNTDLYNENDIVPQAWCLDPTADRYLQRINTEIYTTSVLPGKILRAIVNILVDTAEADSRVTGIGYYGIPGVGFNCGTLSTITKPGGLTSSLKTQHVANYWDYLGVATFVHAVFVAAGYLPSTEEVESGKAAEDFKLHGSAADLKGPVSTIQQVEIVDL